MLVEKLGQYCYALESEGDVDSSWLASGISDVLEVCSCCSMRTVLHQNLTGWIEYRYNFRLLKADNRSSERGVRRIRRIEGEPRINHREITLSI